MSQTYQVRRRAGTAPAAQAVEDGAHGPSMGELAAGAQPTQEQLGHRVDLPDAIREKMESSFGADFSNVKLYESQSVADAGAEAMTQGSNIAFAPGELDLASTAGQALLGHELSHVVSQARGESAGQGFLNDAHLEAQADRQGMMAAQGESVYSGPVSPIGASSAMSAAGPMQAKKKDKPEIPLAQQAAANNISEPEIDAAQTSALNAEVNEPITSKYVNSTSSWLNDNYDGPILWQGRQAWQKSVTENHASDLYGAAEPDEDDMRYEWNLLRANDTDDTDQLEQYKKRAYNGMTFENFKLGVANARKRKGLGG